MSCKRLCLSIAGLLCLLLAGGCATSPKTVPFSMDYSKWVKHYNAQEINDNPSIIDGKIIKGSRLDGLRLENLTLRNVTFWYTVAEEAFFRNVTFVNCRFVAARFTKTTLENVLFEGGVFTCENDADNIDQRSYFSDSMFRKVVFDAVSLDNPVFGLNNSSLTFKNMHNFRAKEPMVLGRNIFLTLDSCIMKDIPALTAINGNSRLEVSNCLFDKAYMGPSRFAKVNFVDSVSYGGPVYTPPK